MGISTNESTIENMINTINLSIMQLRPESPTNTSCLSTNNNSECDAGISTLLTSVEPPKRSPHCSTCHHTRTGHGNGSNAKCTMCPNDICSAAGRHKQCICQWHISQSNSTETVIPYSIVTFTIVNDHVNEYLLSFCQSNLNNQLLGSNACTIIAVVAAVNFLSETAWFSQHNLISTLDSSFLAYCDQLFTEGNQMYDNLDEAQINYSAPDILEHPELGLTDIAERGDEYQFNNFADFLLELQHLLATRVKLAFVFFILINLWYY